MNMRTLNAAEWDLEDIRRRSACYVCSAGLGSNGGVAVLDCGHLCCRDCVRSGKLTSSCRPCRLRRPWRDTRLSMSWVTTAAPSVSQKHRPAADDPALSSQPVSPETPCQPRATQKPGPVYSPAPSAASSAVAISNVQSDLHTLTAQMLSLGPGRVSWDAQVEELLDVDSQLDNGLKNGSIDTWQLQEVQAYVATLAGNFAVYIRERDARQECARQLEMRGRADSRLLQELQYVFDQQHVDKEDLAPLEDVIDVYSEVIQKFGNVFNRHQQT